MKINYYISVFLLLPTFLTSCSKSWLDTKPDKTVVVPESLYDYQGLLDNFTTMNSNFPNGATIAGETYYYLTDAVFDGQAQSYRTDTYKWSKTVPHTVNQDWNLSYDKILVDNIILDGLPKVSVITTLDQEKFNNVKGQALFHRAYVFFCLLQTFGAPYNPATSNSDPGIPLRINSDITIPTHRNSVKECYDLIIRDVNEALNLLPEKAKILTRPSKAAAHAFLSRVYLSMEDYDNSLTHATASLGMNSSLIDFNQLPAGGAPIGRYNVEVLYHCIYGTSIIANGLINLDFYNTYVQDDLRRSRYFLFRASNNTVRYVGNYESTVGVYFCGLANDEVYLNKAECLARKGKTIESIEVLNTLVKTRWNKNVAYPKYEATNPEAALSLILAERKKELVFKGVLRWMDLRRLNKDPRYATTLIRTLKGETLTLEPNSYKYALPIPDDVIQNSGIEQNLGWEK